MIEHCQKLQILNLSWNGNINDNAMKSIATYGLSLQSLSIQQCQGITDIGLKNIENLLNLKVLDIRYCYVTYVDALKILRKDLNVIDYPMISY